MQLNGDDFENEVRAALRRTPAPEGFAQRLSQRLRPEEKNLPTATWRRPAAWAIAAGLLIAAALPPAVVQYRHSRREKAMEAARQVEFALRLTSAKLRETREKVQRATRQKS